MPVTYVNRKGHTYFLHRGKTRTGKPKYFFSRKATGDPADAIPDGYEIYEEPTRAQVFLQRIEPRAIQEAEKRLVEQALEARKSSRRYLVHVRRKTLTILESNEDIEALRRDRERFGFGFLRGRFAEILERSLSYTALLRFTLVDEERRLFSPERFCFRGSVDDWITIGAPEPLDALVERFVGRLGTDAFYELYPWS